MATIKKAQLGSLIKKGLKTAAKKATPKIESSVMEGAMKKAGRADLKAKMKNWDAELSKKKMKNGGSLSSLDASTKRDKGIDPKGAYTTVQKKTLAGAKGKAKLTADKQLGATKMKAKKKVSKKK